MATSIAISKSLSANDVGLTGAHQAGMLIPKDPRILGFFPKLDPSRKNPRVHLKFVDDTMKEWEFAFIYYNNKHHDPKGTRNEYRLTRMTKYIAGNALKVDDEIILSLDTTNVYRIAYRRSSPVTLSTKGVLRLGSGWHIVSL